MRRFYKSQKGYRYIKSLKTIDWSKLSKMNSKTIIDGKFVLVDCKGHILKELNDE